MVWGFFSSLAWTASAWTFLLDYFHSEMSKSTKYGYLGNYRSGYKKGFSSFYFSDNRKNNVSVLSQYFTNIRASQLFSGQIFNFYS